MKRHTEKLEKAFQRSTFEEFDEKVAKQSKYLKQQIAEGKLENKQFTTGLELETYVVDDSGNIKLIDSDLLNSSRVNPELGLHNIEINLEPQECSPKGFRELENELRGKVEEFRNYLPENSKLQFDSVWTQGESPLNYFSEKQELDGFRFMENMKSATRYHGLDNALLEKNNGKIKFEVPGISREFDSLLFESLATSMQPHLQIPETSEFPKYYRYAIRSMAPILAITSNSPFLPPQLYNKEIDAEKLVDQSFHELRIPIFEQIVNTSEDYSRKKCRVPDDIKEPEELLDMLKEDETYYPWLRKWSVAEEGFKDNFWELEYKRGTFWRWVRPVFGGQKVKNCCDEKSLRLEYRPIPTQPTIKDIISVQAMTVGMIKGMVSEEHPVKDLEWVNAKENFYNVVKDGMNAEITWIDGSGSKKGMETALRETISLSKKGLEDFGFKEDKIDQLLMPLEKRIESEVTPSIWKKNQVRQGLRQGLNLEEAIEKMQQTYFKNSREKDSFSDWI